jgi:hypothetical protein
MTLGQRCVLRGAAAGRSAAAAVQGAGQPVRGRVHRVAAMNFARAELVRDDGLALVFAGYRLPVGRR